MESRQGFNRSSLLSRRMNSEGAAAFEPQRSGRYDRNRFAKLDLGKGEPAPSIDSIRTGISLYEGGRIGGTGLYDSGRVGLGLYEGGARSGLYEGVRGTGGTGLYDSGRLAGGRIGLYNSSKSVDGKSDFFSSGKFDIFEGERFDLDNGERFRSYNEEDKHRDSGDTYSYEDGGDRGEVLEEYVQPQHVNGNYSHVDNGLFGSELDVRSEDQSGSDDVVYYRLVDNYTIFKLETVDPSSNCHSSSGTASTMSTPPTTPLSSTFQKPFLQSLKSGADIPVHLKLNLIKKLEATVEELQQKIARLQLEVEDQDIATTYFDSKFGGYRNSDHSNPVSSTNGKCESDDGDSTTSSNEVTCSGQNRCPHFKELESMRRQKEALQADKFHLEEQIVQLRSSKSIVHGTDSEKRVTKLEAENIQLRAMIEKLRNQQMNSNAEDGKPERRDQKNDMESRINDVVQRLKERHNLIPSSSSSPATTPSATAAARFNSRDGFASEIAVNDATGVDSFKKAMGDKLKYTSYAAQDLAEELKQTRHQCCVLKRWLAGHVQNILLQMRLLSKHIGGENSTNDNQDNTTNPPDWTMANNDILSSQAHILAPLESILNSAINAVAADPIDGGESRSKVPYCERSSDGTDLDMQPMNNNVNDVGSNIPDEATKPEKDGIRVVCRVRPSLKEEEKSSSCILSPVDSRIIQLSYRGRVKTFEVDDTFESTDSQHKVFDSFKDRLPSCLEGNYVNLVAYGETGSGKTFTVQGSGEQPGLVHLITGSLLDEMKNREDEVESKMTMSVIELHNESIRDLLSVADPSHKLETKPHGDGSLSIPGLTQINVQKASDAAELLKRSQENRNKGMGASAAADHAARSHLIVSFWVTATAKSNPSIKLLGKVNLVDLAGSERIEKTASDPSRFKEAQSINKSLTCLGDVLYALLAKQAHIPYRSSKLTHVLQDSLSGRGSSTLLIVQLVSAEKRSSETMSSLMFAHRVRNLDTGSSTASVKGTSEGGSGSRTPVEPMSQRPRRPSATGLADRLAVYTGERRSSISQSSDKRPPPATPSNRRPSGTNGKTTAGGPREKSETRNEARATTPLSRPRSSLRLAAPPTPPAKR